MSNKLKRIWQWIKVHIFHKKTFNIEFKDYEDKALYDYMTQWINIGKDKENDY